VKGLWVELNIKKKKKKKSAAQKKRKGNKKTRRQDVRRGEGTFAGGEKGQKKDGRRGVRPLNVRTGVWGPRRRKKKKPHGMPRNKEQKKGGCPKGEAHSEKFRRWWGDNP